jgi:hypothetical protein
MPAAPPRLPALPSRARITLGVAGLALAGLVAAPAPVAAQLVGSISGTVTAGGSPVANVWVSATPVTPTGDWAGRGFVTSTDALGRYSFPDVYVPHVKVQARAPALSALASTYWPRAFSFESADVLGVASSGSTADIELAPGGSVSGTVVAGASGGVVGDARVTAYLADEPGIEPVGSARLAPPGEFRIEGLPPAPVVLFAEAAGGNLLGQWYDGVGFAGVATPLDGASATTGIRIPLARGGEVRGSVLDDAGEPVVGAQVTLTHCPGLCPMVATTDERGAYRIGSVPAGRGLMLRAAADDQGFLADWHRGPAGGVEQRLDLEPGDTLSGLDMELVRGAFLSVSVVDDASGAPVPGISAELESLSDPLLGFLPGTRDRLVVRSGSGFLSSGESSAVRGDEVQVGSGTGGPGAEPGVESGSTDAGTSSGRFVIGPVPPGEYRLSVYPGYRNPRYVPVAWGEPSGIAGDGVIRLSAGERAEAVVPLVGSSSPPAGGGSPGSGPAGQEGAAPCSGQDSSVAPPVTPQSVDPAGGARAGSSAATAWPGVFAGFLAASPPGWVAASS